MLGGIMMLRRGALFLAVIMLTLMLNGCGTMQINNNDSIQTVQNSKQLLVDDVVNYVINHKADYNIINIVEKYINNRPHYFVVLREGGSWKYELYLVKTGGSAISDLTYIADGNEDQFSFDVVSITQGNFVSVYSATHMGNGELELISFDTPDRVAYSFWAIDAFHEGSEQTAIEYGLSSGYGQDIYASSVYKDGILHAEYADINGDGKMDVILSGIKEIYTKGLNLEKRYYCRMSYIYNPAKDTFELDDSLSTESLVFHNTDIEPPSVVKFNDEELKQLELIKEYYPDFIYTDSYTYTIEADKKIVYDRNTNPDVAMYNSYNAVFNMDYSKVDYSFDAGTGHRGYGTYYVVNDNMVVNVEKSVGEFSYCCIVTKNGVVVDVTWGDTRNEDGSLIESR
jgi:hypothetical protein